MSNKNYIEKSFTSAGEFIKALEKCDFLEGDRSDFIFRGVSDKKFDLLPNVLRTENDNFNIEFRRFKNNKLRDNVSSQILYESKLFDLFINSDNKIELFAKKIGYPNIPKGDLDINKSSRNRFLTEPSTWPPNTYLPTLALAQHLGVPTRLLDWTKNIYTAAFFAAYLYVDKPSEEVAIWCFDKRAVSNVLPEIKIIEDNYLGVDHEVAIYLKAQEGVATLIREKGSPQDQISRISLEQCNFGEYIEKYKRQPLTKLTLHSVECQRLLHLLNKNGTNAINALKLFPDFKGIALHTRNLVNWYWKYGM